MYVVFEDREKKAVNVAPRDHWDINMGCLVSRFDPLTSINNQLVFHLLPSQIKMVKKINCFSDEQLKDIDGDNNVLMFWDIK
ncbi:MAG: hypothetical protein ACI905_002486 [Roseivirga sp.]